MKVFIDTNVLVYANDADVPLFRAIAVGLLASLAEGGEGVISSQVLVEYGSVGLGSYISP